MIVESMKDFVEALSAIGWTPGRDEVGDQNAQIRIGEHILKALLGRRDTRFPANLDGVLVFSMGGWITTDAMSAVYTKMRYPKKKYSVDCPILLSNSFTVVKPLVCLSDIGAMSDQLLAWAKECNIDACLKALRDAPTNSIGNTPIRHLAALAETGDVETLTGYLDSFASGDRLGFVPYINDGFISTALDFAKHRRADPHWLPKSPRMRV